MLRILKWMIDNPLKVILNIIAFYMILCVLVVPIVIIFNKFFDKKEDSKDNIIGELGVTLTYNDFIGFNTSYQIKKSLNTSDYIDKVEIGIKFKF